MRKAGVIHDQDNVYFININEVDIILVVNLQQHSIANVWWCIAEFCS